MNEFKVSVIIPVYNSEKYLKRAVDSCINLPQTGEVIIIDDGSTDKSLEIAHQLKHEYNHIKVLQHPDKKNHGRSESRNLGIVNAQYDFISFLDSDDWYLPNRFENEEKIFMENPAVEGIYGITKAVFKNEIVKERFLKRFDSIITKVKDNINSDELYKTFIFGNYGRFTTDAITFKKTVFDKVGLFDTRFIVMQDTHLWCKISAKCLLVSNQNPMSIACRGVHEDNSIINTDNLRQQLEFLMHNDWLIWALKQKDFNYDKKNDFFIGYKKMYPNESDVKTFIKFIIHNPLLLFNIFTWRKIIQIIK